MTPVELGAAFEAILFASHRALKVRELQGATGAEKRDTEAGLEALDHALAGRGVMLQRFGDEVQIVTSPAQAPFVRRALRPEVTGRLSPAAY